MTNRNSPEPAGKDLGSRCRRGTNGVVWPQFSCLSNGLLFASHCQDPETRLGRGVALDPAQVRQAGSAKEVGGVQSPASHFPGRVPG